MLFTVAGFLDIDYPKMLADQEMPALEAMILLRDPDDGAGQKASQIEEHGEGPRPAYRYHGTVAKRRVQAVQSPGFSVEAGRIYYEGWPFEPAAGTR